MAIGDEVPYGVGLANPGPETHDHLPVRQPPSRKAYPSVLAKALNLTLNIRKTGCTLVGDQLAVSGAPTVKDNINGHDSDCGSSKGHKTVDPSELVHLRKVRAQVVTIQAGADDIEYSGCILHELGISLKYKIFGQSTSNCISGTGLTDRIARRITRFRIGLNTILNTVRRKQPKATIVLLNYYQPLPSPSQFVTLDKSYICERLKDPKRLQNAYRASVTIQDNLNRAIKQSVAQHPGVHLVSLAYGSRMTGHTMCTRHPYLFTGGPKNHFWRVTQPNQAGQAAIASTILHQVPGLKKK